jgi:tRNA(Ile)-lysidine synthetase-like protein
MATDEHERVLRFWFDGSQTELFRSKWFPLDGSEKQRVMDAEIAASFGELLESAERGELSAWKQTRDGFVALIVLLDQFSRHVYRQRRDHVEQNDALALALANELVKRGWHASLPVPHFVFAMMPLRHTPTAERLRDVLAAVDDRQQLHAAHAELLEKFRKTTQHRLAHLRGDVVAQSDDDILERPLVETDESSMPRHRLYKAMHEYLAGKRAREFAYVAVSLSGGVDSMVIAYLLHKLRSAHNDYGIVAVHLDYGNRTESGAESDYVRRWCDRFGIVFHVRRIDEVKRATTKRDDYERVSREIRYATYAHVLQQYGAPGMCFGHHRGDVQENVISNMMKGQSLLSLNGMSESSVVNGVRIWRPLLAFDKDAIFDFAHTYGVPYFKDTTPLWSTRGKLRTQLVPLLRDMYGDGFLSNLSNLGAESMQCGELIDQTILSPILRGVRQSDAAVWIDCRLLSPQPFFVWKEVLRTICHAYMGNAMVRDKPIRELMAKLARHDGEATGDQWITLKKGNRSFLTAQQTLIVFRDRLFPKQLAFTPGTVLTLGETYVFGPWTVSTALVEENDRLVEKWRRGDVLTLSEFVETARIEYTLPRRESLVLSCEDRPPTLRMREKPVTDHTPLVVTRGATAAGEFVHVTLVYCNGPGTH